MMKNEGILQAATIEAAKHGARISYIWTWTEGDSGGVINVPAPDDPKYNPPTRAQFEKIIDTIIENLKTIKKDKSYPRYEGKAQKIIEVKIK